MLLLCNGMIRSGSTLQYNLVRSLVEECAIGEAHGYLREVETQGFSDNLLHWARDEKYHVIKRHILPSNLEMLSSQNGIKIFYIYRDIRDVAVSIKNKWKKEGKELMESLDEAISVYYQVAALEYAFIQKYEYVVNNINKSVEELAAYIEAPVTKDIVAKISRENCIENSMSSIGNMNDDIFTRLKITLRPYVKRLIGVKGTAMLKTMIPSLSIYDRSTLLHPDHISKHKGASGVWQQELTKSEIGMIMEKYESWLLEAGYIVT